MTRMMIASAALGALAACGSPEIVMDQVKNARGQGVTREIQGPYDKVYGLVLAVASRKKLELVEQDKSTGRILLASGMSAGSFGERIAVFVSRSGPRSTNVEIVSRPVSQRMTTHEDWPKVLFADIEYGLASDRMFK
jgi:hypothetical protein